MSKLCGSLITKEYKKAKANSIRPTEPFTNPDRLPICGGTIRFSIDLYHDYYEGSVIDINATCSRCKVPYFTGIDRILSGGTSVIEDLLNA
jgi:hypothetical protein